MDEVHLTDAMLSTLDMLEAGACNVRHARTRYGTREPIAKTLRQLIYERDGWACRWCGLRQGEMMYTYEDNGWTRVPLGEVRIVLDHIWPWSDHGEDRSWNLRVLCWDCNSDRSNLVTDTAAAAVLPISHCCTRCCDDCLEHQHAGEEHMRAWCGYCRLGGTTEGPREAML